ncbi:Corticotropin-releasing factor conserved site,Corticotropin-releasing factor [Cinara cedri]|uniref:Corticotropin-releasing factor conserved site,Corticotropin-releasing factor n=1 Tax=Cinara cedri TaxID=506608 RepID=A0A5E4NM21_9HEMI|nr:Corticotropin-releasing factor conserved site,Corticotropin-releasing factor [Cinara cedri]
MRLLTFVWTLAVAVTLCCDGAMIYDPLVQRDARWYDARNQDLESIDKNFFDMASIEKRMLRNSDNQDGSARSRPSLSIVNSLDVLRQKLMYEVARRQVDENQKVMSQNHQILKTLGKRSLFPYFGVPQRF